MQCGTASKAVEYVLFYKKQLILTKTSFVFIQVGPLLKTMIKGRYEQDFSQSPTLKTLKLDCFRNSACECETAGCVIRILTLELRITAWQ